MAWKTTTDDRIEATAYARDLSADSVFRELSEDGGQSFAEDERELPNYYDSNWKTYRITIVIEQA